MDAVLHEGGAVQHPDREQARVVRDWDAISRMHSLIAAMHSFKDLLCCFTVTFQVEERRLRIEFSWKIGGADERRVVIS